MASSDILKDIAALRQRISSSPIPGSPSSPSSRARHHHHQQHASDPPVVLDIGAREIRAGITGQPGPVCVVPVAADVVRRSKRQGEGGEVDVDVALWPLDVRCAGSEERTRDVLQVLLARVYYNHLLLDGRSRKVVVLERPRTPIWIKRAIAFVLFNYLQAISVSFLLSPVCSVIAAGTHSALVVDIGWHETTVTPIYDYKPILIGILSSTRSASHLHSLVAAALQEYTGTAPSFDEVEDFIVRAAYLPSDLSSSSPSSSSSSSAFAISIGTTPHYVPSIDTRCVPVQTCFLTPSSLDDIEHQPLPTLIASSLSKLPIDARAALQQRIIFVGGAAAIPGLKPAVLNQLRDRFPGAKGIKSLGAWAGASLYLACEREQQMLARSAAGAAGGRSIRIPGEIERDRFLLERGYAENIYDWSHPNS